MIKKFVIAIVYCATCIIYSQNGTVSPYSFGIGDLKAAGTVENQMMGGVAIYADSIHINLRNPAAYSKLALTTYTAGLTRKESRLKTFDDQENASVSNLDYLAIGLPLGKGFGLGFGLMPFSSVGYNSLIQGVNAEGADFTYSASGDGGLNRLYTSLGYEIFEDFSIGATINFNFGTLNNNRVQTIEGVQFGTLDRRESRVNGFDFNYSVNYTPKISEKYRLYTSVGVINVNLQAQGLKNTEIRVPTTTTLGLGIGGDKKWFLGAEYSLQGLSSYENDFLSRDNVEYDDASTFGFGGFFVPDYSSFTSYFKRVTYRAGAKLTKTGLLINDKEINNFGITFGVGLPLGGSFSNLNIGFELGRMGTTDADLVEESYLKMNLGLSLNDKWFQKRKIN